MLQITNTRIIDLIDLICEEFNFDPEFKTFIFYIYKGLNGINWFDSKIPTSVTGGLIYWCVREKKKKYCRMRELSYILENQTCTISKHYKELARYMDKNFM